MPNLFNLLRGRGRASKTVSVCVDHFQSLVIWRQTNLKLSTCYATAPSMWMGACLPPFPVVHDQLLGLIDIEEDQA